MQTSERSDALCLNAALDVGDRPRACGTVVFYLVALLTRQQPMILVKIVDHYEQHQRMRFAGQLLSLLRWDSRSVEIAARVKALEREAVRYDSQSAEKIFDAMEIGICLRHTEQSGLRVHLLLNATRLSTWAEFKREVTSTRRAQANLGPIPIPRQVKSFQVGCVDKRERRQEQGQK
eukprot:4044018-Amphidinium_carterae.3